MKKIIPDMVFQGEIHECGLACIAMLAETQELDISLQELRARFPASDNGTTLKGVSDILAELNIAAYPVVFSFDELASLPLPAILHYGASHYVLLAYRKGDYVCVMNPGVGQQLLPLSALKTQISGYALVLDEERQNAKKNPKQKQKRRPLLGKTLDMSETARVRGIYALMICAFLMSLTMFIMPGMVNNAMTQAFSSAHSAFSWPLFLLVFASSSALSLGMRVITERVIKRFLLLRSTQGFSQLLSNSLRYFDKRAPGEIFSRFSAWQGALTQKIELDNGLRTDWVIALIALVLMCWISPALAAVSGVGVMFMGAVSVWAIFRDRFYTQQLQEKSAEQNDFILETIQGFSTIKSAGLESQRQQAFARHAWTLATWVQKQRVYEQIKNSLYQFIGSAGMVFFMALALPMLSSNAISLGAFFAYNFIQQIFSSSITKIFYSIIHKNQLRIIDNRAEDLFPAVEEVANNEAPEPFSFHQSLKFSDIAFDYGRSDVLKGVSLSLVKGRHVAIVGESGAGKTTLLRIIAGLLPASQGSIIADGQVIHSQQAGSLVFLQTQEDILFHTSVFQNITLFDEQVDEIKRKRVMDSISALMLDEVISAIPGAENALIRESHAALSVGQRQRLLLARAMYSNKPVMVLDEPTASLDAETAFTVMTALLDHCRETGKTLVTVTHTESLLPLFDEVLRLEHGNLVPVSGRAETTEAGSITHDVEVAPC